MEILVLPFDYLRRFYLDTALLSQLNVYLCICLLAMRIVHLLHPSLTMCRAGLGLKAPAWVRLGKVRDHENVEPPWSTAWAGLGLRARIAQMSL